VATSTEPYAAAYKTLLLAHNVLSVSMPSLQVPVVEMNGSLVPVRCETLAMVSAWAIRLLGCSPVPLAAFMFLHRYATESQPANSGAPKRSTLQLAPKDSSQVWRSLPCAVPPMPRVRQATTSQSFGC